ncbi:MAG TPA: glycine--tRNA ligase subunit beta [Thermodesulfovibrionales bacterium]|nr:glycine--tRNA ligase subunit beta [Thermodesulfovibrionales bacterium]
MAPKSPVDSPSSLLLEIGTEEIPARFLPSALMQLRDNAESLLNDHLIGFSEIKTYATPRRLALLAKGIPAMQKERVKEVLGPSKKVAFDENGAPTKAALGFAQSQGIEASSLTIKKKDKGEYVVAIIQQEGAAVKELLPELLRKIVLSLNFPKAMRWGNGDLKFARPIHWIIALLSGEIIPFELDGIKSGNITKGHRFLSPGSFVLKEIPSYPHLLENNYVIVDHYERKKRIEAGIGSLASAVEGRPLKDEDLLNTVTFLVEYPVPVLCSFEPDYLRLPRELLVTVMKDHQKYFAVEDEESKLKNYFIVISNTKDENSGTIKIGAERVIKARFEDARFYYEEDVKKTLQSRLQDLKRVTFHDRLGSLYDKTERVEKLALFLAERLAPDKKKNIERAARLCKTDLISGVVGEFPELQGLMGKYYALRDGEQAEVADAIMQQYLPAHSGDRLPQTDEGSILSLSDKIDNVVSFFAVGIVPTGSEDPFALRRQALAVITILMEKSYPVSLWELIGNAAGNDAAETKPFPKEVLSFFIQRLEPLLSSQGHGADIIQSVIHFAESDNVPLCGIKERIHAISRFREDRDYSGFLLAVKRIGNIITTAVDSEISEKLLFEEQERILHDNILTAGPDVDSLLKDGKYYDAIKVLSALTESITNFFDKVLVMDKRKDVQKNRLALLRKIWSMSSQIADFSKLRETR